SSGARLATGQGAAENFGDLPQPRRSGCLLLPAQRPGDLAQAEPLGAAGPGDGLRRSLARSPAVLNSYHPMYPTGSAPAKETTMGRNTTQLLKLLGGFAAIFLVFQVLGQVLNTCHDGACSGSPSEVVLTFVTPLGAIATALAVEMLLFGETLLQAVRALGL